MTALPLVDLPGIGWNVGVQAVNILRTMFLLEGHSSPAGIPLPLWAHFSRSRGDKL